MEFFTKEQFDRQFVAYCPISLKKPSGWTFNTSATGGISVGLYAASGGFIQLKDPSENIVDFYYAGAGAGLGWGKSPKIPKFPKIDLKNKSGSFSTSDFNSYGSIYITEAFKGDELSSSDLSGPCVFIDGGLNLFVGGSATLLLLGIAPQKIAMLSSAFTVSPVLFSDILKSAKSVLVITGVNAASQIGLGISGNLGYLHCSRNEGSKKPGPYDSISTHPNFQTKPKHGIYSPERQSEIKKITTNNPGATTP